MSYRPGPQSFDLDLPAMYADSRDREIETIVRLRIRVEYRRNVPDGVLSDNVVEQIESELLDLYLDL